MEKKLVTIPLIFFIVFAYYLPPLIGISVDGSNLIVVIVSCLSVSIALISKQLFFKKSEILLILTQFVIAILALKVNMISLSIIVILNIFFTYQNDNKNLKYFTETSLLLFLVIVGSHFVFGFNNQFDTSIWRIDSVVNRSSIGFQQPNQAMISWFGVFLGFILNVNFRKKIAYFLIFLSTCMVYLQTKSRTGFIILIIILFFMFIFKSKLNNEVPVLLKYLLVLLPIVLFCVSIWLVTQSNNLRLNSLLSGRPALYKQFFDSIGITVWGNSSIEDQMLDNSYLSILLGKGIIFTIFYLITLIYLIFSTKKLSFKNFIVLSLFFVYGVTETLLFRFDLLLPIIMSMHATKKIKQEDGISFDS